MNAVCSIVSDYETMIGEKNLLLEMTLVCSVCWFRPILGTRGSMQKLSGFGGKESKSVLS